MKTGPARIVSHVGIEARDIGEESDDFELVLSACPVYGEAAIKVYKACELGICL